MRTNGSGTLNERDENYFTGFIANTNKRMATDGQGNAVVGNLFHVRNEAISYNQGWIYNLTGNKKVFRPMNAHKYDYVLGEDNNRFDESFIRTMNGTLAGTSSHNAKMNIEDISGQQAFDYFSMMKVKSYFYKDDDYTIKFNKKVSPVIEQLDPALEKLYKASDDSLDINSNLFLLVRAFQH